MTEAYKGWALVEQMGFRRSVGIVSEVETFGTKMLRLDVPVFDGEKIVEYVTRFCGGPSLYQITPMSDDVGVAAARQQEDPRPVNPTKFRLAAPPEDYDHDDD